VSPWGGLPMPMRRRMKSPLPSCSKIERKPLWPPHGDTVNYVLGTIPPDQMESLPRVLDGGLDMLELMLREGLPKAMSLFNNKNFLEG